MQDLNEIIKEVRMQKRFYNDLKLKLKKQIAELPKGSIQKRIIKNNPYYYLQYRKQGKVTQDYIGSNVPSELQKQITRRQSMESELRPINEKLKILRKFKV